MTDNNTMAVKKVTWTEGSTEMPIQVDSAVRDGTGVTISTNYARCVSFPISTSADTTIHNEQFAGSHLSKLGTKRPKIIQIYDNTGKEVGGEVQITSTGITVNLIGTTAGQTWNVYVTAW